MAEEKPQQNMGENEKVDFNSEETWTQLLGSKVKIVHSQPAVAEGENHASDLKRVQIQVLQDGGTWQLKYYIIKKELAGEKGERIKRIGMYDIESK